MSRDCGGENLVVLAAAFALAISEGMSADEMNILGALFNTIGDQLSLMAAAQQACATGGDASAGAGKPDAGKSG